MTSKGYFEEGRKQAERQEKLAAGEPANGPETHDQFCPARIAWEALHDAIPELTREPLQAGHGVNCQCDLIMQVKNSLIHEITVRVSAIPGQGVMRESGMIALLPQSDVMNVIHSFSVTREKETVKV